LRRLRRAALVAALCAGPAAARADLVDFLLDASVGVPWQTSPGISRLPTNVMVTPGILLVGWVSAELGVVGAVAQFGQPARWALRPMVGLYPPFMPLYAKLVVDVANLNQAGGLGVLTSVGGALGLKFGLGPVALFAEGDYIPQAVNGKNLQVVEGRAGVGVKL